MKGVVIVSEAIVESKHILLKNFFSAVKPVLSNLALIFAGSIIFVIGLKGVLVPNRLLTGGLAGLSMLIYYLFPALNIGWGYIALNIPLMILGWRSISHRFMLYPIFGVGIFSLAVAAIKPPAFEIKDPILAALLAGVICGVGGGLILRSQGSGGGLSILSVYLKKKMGCQIGTTVFLFNALVLVGGVYFYSLQMALYSLIYLFTAGKVINSVVTGFNRRKSLMIISNKSERIAQALLHDRNRGITLLNGEGGFTHQKKNIIFTITNQLELTKAKEIILDLDPDAFIVVTDTFEVFGKRLGNNCVY